MTSQILKCKSCGTYGLDAECKCGSERKDPTPAKFNPNDKYSKYRARYKKQEGLF